MVMYLAACIALIVTGYLLHLYANRRDEKKQYWDGPVPSKEEANKNQNWISDHLIKYPDSMHDLGKDFPQAVNRAKAVLRYNELEELYKAGKVTPEFYYSELDQIAGLIDLSEDITS